MNTGIKRNKANSEKFVESDPGLIGLSYKIMVLWFRFTVSKFCTVNIMIDLTYRTDNLSYSWELLVILQNLDRGQGTNTE